TLWRWHKIDQLLNESVDAAFHVSPQNVFANRAIPLGFDEDPDVLYFASDAGRDTFGIFSLRLSSGELAETAFRNPDFDLVPPVLDGFPEDVLIFDRFSRKLFGVRYTGARRTTAWTSKEWQDLQAGLEE